MKKTIAILVFDDVEVLDFAEPFEVFAVTDELNGHSVFNVILVSEKPGTLRARNGLKILADYTLEDSPEPDILVIPGGQGTRPLLEKPALLEWIRRKARTSEVVFSICTGALVLAKAGLLDGLRVTTHAGAIELLRKMAPNASVEPGARFHDNGHIVTAAGISAGIDASLHLVGRLLGKQMATATATYMEYGI